MSWARRPYCSHVEWSAILPLYQVQRIGFPSRFVEIRRALVASQRAHLKPFLRMRFCLECDELRRA